MNEPTERSRQVFESYRRYLLPLLAVGEAIATQGKSPGTTALTAEQTFQTHEEKQREYERQRKEEELAEQSAAIERALRGAQTEYYGEKTAESAEARERAATQKEAWEQALEGTEDITPTERAAFKGAGEQSYLDYLLGGKRLEAGLKKLIETLASKEKIAGEKALSAKDIALLKLAFGQKKEGEKKKKGDLKDWLKAKSNIDRKYKPIELLITTADAVMDALKSRNPAVYEPIKSQVMRMFGEGARLTDQDIQRAGGNPAWLAKFKRWGRKGFVGLPREEDIEDIISLVQILKNRQHIRLNNMLDQQESIYKGRGIDVSDITGEYRIGGATLPEETPGGASDILSEIRARRESRGQK